MKISTIVIGTDYYSTKYSDETCTQMLDLYLENGGTMIDTARLYCGGKSEEFIGDYLRKKKIKDGVYIATKAAHPPVGNMNCSRLSKEEIEHDVDLSLKALRIECIDLLWLHRDDKSLSVEPIIDTLDGLVRAGKIRHYGASNWCGERIAEANRYASSISSEGFIASQIQWSLAKHNGSDDPTLVIMNDSQYDFYRRTKMPVFAFCSQAKGFFEKYAVGALSEKSKERFYNEENVKTFERLKEESEKTGRTISSLSLDYLICNKDFDTYAIIGPSSTEQLKCSLNI